MRDWDSLAEVARDARAFVNFMHTLLGLYTWEIFVSKEFDWNLIRGRKTFRWPMVFYFANRYLLLLALIGIIVALDSTSEIDCQSLYTFNQLTGNAAVGLASINLSIRTMAVWMHNKYIVCGLTLIILGHWSLILQGALLKATYIPDQGCIIVSTNNAVLVATFIYSMCFDFIVLLLNAWKLSSLPDSWLWPASGASQERWGVESYWRKSKIGTMIFRDGLVYFGIAFLANLLATVFMLLNLNSIMNVIFNVPAAVASTVVACRVVQRLTSFSTDTVEVFVDNRSRNSRPTSAFRAASPFSGLSHGGHTAFPHQSRGVITPSPAFGQYQSSRKSTNTAMISTDHERQESSSAAGNDPLTPVSEASTVKPEVVGRAFS